MATRRLVELSADDKARMIAEAREKNRRDVAAYAKDAREEGRIEGRRETARKMLRHSRPQEEIAEMTGLSRQEIEALQNTR